MFGEERLNVVLGRRLASEVRDVQGEEIAGVHEPVHVLQADMVCINMVFPVEADGVHGGGDGVPHVLRASANDGVLAVRFVPHGDDGDSSVLRLEDGAQLRLGLMPESVSDTHAVFGQLHDLFLLWSGCA